MTLIDIENMTADALKAVRQQAVADLGGSDLAERYVQARLDAKLRDERLAEQGRTITALNDALNDWKQRTVAAENACNAATNAGERAIVALREDLSAAKNRIATLEEVSREQVDTINDWARRFADMEALAKARRTALVDVMNFAGQLSGKVAPLLAE